MSIQKVFDQGRTGLAISQKGLSATGHNIANVNTEGYSRQRVEAENIEPSNSGANRVGGGVRIRQVSRAHSDFVTRRLEKEGTDLGMSKAKSDLYMQIENVFVNDAEQGLSKTMSSFFNDVRSLTTNPSSMPMRSSVIESAKNVARDFNRVSEALDDIRVDLDNRIEGTVSKINSLSQRISNLNKSIMGLEGAQGVANDERDQRDLAILELSKLVDVQVTNVDNGGVNVSSGRMGPLVSGIDNFDIQAVRQDTEHYAGAVKVVQRTSKKNFNDQSAYIKNGELGAYLQTRDTYLSGIKEDLNKLASEFSSRVNGVSTGAFNIKGEPGGPVFGLAGSGSGEAGRMTLSEELRLDPSKLAGSLQKGTAGDNSAFLDLADLETSVSLDGKTLLDYNSELIGRVGFETRSVNEALDTQQGIFSQLENLREEESGVSLDEEAMNMVKYQKAFDASAKVVQVADSMLETVLALKRF